MAAALVLVLAVLAAPAGAETSATTTHRGDPQRDNRVTGAPDPPLGVLWAKDMGDPVSYPVIAGGSVYVTTHTPGSQNYGTVVTALDLATGAVRWTRPTPGTYYWSDLTYDNGRLFVVNFDGVLAALDPGTGATLWSIQLGQYAFDGPPTADAGVVYVAGAGSSGTVYAVRETDGTVMWSSGVGTGGAVAADTTGVYKSEACTDVYGIDRGTGNRRWEHHGGCSGGSDYTPTVWNGRVYPLGESTAVYAASSGAQVGTIRFEGAPSFADGTAYLRLDGGLSAVDAVSWATRWHTAASVDGEPPLIAGSAVYAGVASGAVVAFDRAGGAPVWCASTNGSPIGTANGNVDHPDSGLGAGAGVLVVPADRYLIAYGKGGAAPAPCSASVLTAPPGTGAPSPGPGLTLVPRRTDTIAGRRLRLTGRLTRPAASASAQPVRIEADGWPFDGRWRPRATATTAADGTWVTYVRPGRNTRYRAVSGDLTSPEVAVYADLLVAFARKRLGGGRFRETLYLAGPKTTARPAKRIHFYVVRAGGRVAHLKRSPRLRTVRRGIFRARATLRFLRPRSATVVLACYRERRPDPYGRAAALDPLCGNRRLELPVAAPRASASATVASAAPRDATAQFTRSGR
ncbi:MAG: hypothetical protein QOE28_1874 [Solirubrobacteraceae bacterium]|jgi:outer membrane protein assembly factor BamB|nr:hypothetical protein [Solirubrobacteraceae bacterium]